NRFLHAAAEEKQFGYQPAAGEKVMVEFSSPNTNKPLHLGHIRNILLGWAMSRIFEANGYEVIKTQIVNDRGIAICKSMLAWKKFGEGETPESSNIKSDHLVGKYYVRFAQELASEYQAWQQTDVAKAVFNEKAKDGQDEAAFFKAYENTYFNEYSILGKEAREMLLQWEANDPATRELWKKMNGWVYAGFNETYKKLGVDFDKLYYESDTYLLGKNIVEQGLKDSLFYQKDDGSVWIDLEDAKLDQKLVLRSDGTSVYLTQDLGTAEIRYHDYGARNMIYTVGDEQNYHFKVLFEIMKRMKAPYADGLYHLSYGMVDLPTGKMKSREGTVVDADDLIAEVIREAELNAEEHGKIEGLSDSEQQEILRKIGLAALKFFIVKVNPRKRMTFDPKESVDMQGATGPYIQNAFVRIQGILRKLKKSEDIEALEQGALSRNYNPLKPLEREILIQLYGFPEVLAEAAKEYDPSEVANYCYALARNFHKMYNDAAEYGILNAESKEAQAFRLKLSKLIASVLQSGMDLLGIEMPDRM
ncbi:MAG: arginine--tRNA ligase, partial [Bacteroidota bacterium]